MQLWCQKANLVSDDATLVLTKQLWSNGAASSETMTHALALRPRDCVFTASGGEQTLVPDNATLVLEEGSLVPNDATLVPSATTLVRDKTTLVHNATTLVCDKT
jgi:hypothetical protein